MAWKFFTNLGQEKQVIGIGAGAEVAYAEITAAVTISATTSATANTIVTAPAFIADGVSAYIIEFFCASIALTANGAGNANQLVLYEDGVELGNIGEISTNSANSFNLLARVNRRRVPASGSRTYSIRGFRSNANNTISAGSGAAGTYQPAYIRITKAT